MRWLITLIACGTLAWATSARARAENWTDLRAIGRFQLRANFSLAGHQRLIDQLEQLDRDVQQQLARKPSTAPIHLLLFADRDSYTRYLNRYFAGVPIRRAMFIQGTAPGWVFAYQNDDYEVDLRHETTHALLHSQIPQIPLWLDEGLAEYYEPPPEQRVNQNPYLVKTIEEGRLRQVPSLQRLESLTDVRQMGKSEYQSAWAWVHFMLHGPPAARQALVGYLDSLEAQGATERLEPRLRQAFPELENEFLKHFRNWRP
jgi:hypothetical protein